MVTTFVLVRHGQSTWNAESRWQGQADPPLSELGRAQGRAAAPALAERFGPFAAVISSPQRRAAETAEILVSGIDPGAPSPIQLVNDLRERSAGKWSGLTRIEIEAAYPGFLTSGARPEGYEGDDQLFARVLAALAGVAADVDTTDRQILAVCHGGVINVLVDFLYPARHNRVPNLSGWTATMQDGQLKMGDRFDLLSADQRTGGDAHIV